MVYKRPAPRGVAFCFPWLLIAMAAAQGDQVGETDADRPSPSPQSRQPVSLFEPADENDPTVILKVNGLPLTQGMLNALANKALNDPAQLMKYQLDEDSPADRAEVREFIEQEALERLIGQALFTEAVNAEIEQISSTEIEAEYSKIKAQVEEGGGDFADFINQSGRGEEAVRAGIRRRLAVVRVVERHVGPIEPKLEEILEAFEQRKENFAVPPTRRSSHILLRHEIDPRDAVVPPSEEEQQALWDRAERALERIWGGEEFDAVASEISHLPNAAQGGDVGFNPRGEFPSDIDKAIWSLEVGEVSDPIQTDAGISIVKVTGARPAREAVFEEKQEYIRQNLQRRKLRSSIPLAILAMRGKATIEDLRQGADPPPPATPGPAGAAPRLKP